MIELARLKNSRGISLLSYFFKSTDLPAQLSNIKNLLAEIASTDIPFFFFDPQIKVTTQKCSEILWGEVDGTTLDEVIKNIKALFNIYIIWEQYKRGYEKLTKLGENNHSIKNNRQEFLDAQEKYRRSIDSMEPKLSNIQRSINEYIRQIFLDDNFVFPPDEANSSLGLLNHIKNRKELFQQFVRLRAGDEKFFQLLHSMHENVVKKIEAKIQKPEVTENSPFLNIDSSHGSYGSNKQI
jgi:hypothetical protein